MTIVVVVDSIDEAIVEFLNFGASVSISFEPHQASIALHATSSNSSLTYTMSRRAVSLPFRSLSSSSNTFSAQAQWTCRRCMATQVPPQSDSAPSTYDPTLPYSQRVGPDGQPYRLTKTDRLLKKVLKQRIPVQYLQHSTSEILPPGEKEQREQTVQHKRVVGVVVSSGKMDKTVTVRVGGQTWNKRIGKVWLFIQRRNVHSAILIMLCRCSTAPSNILCMTLITRLLLEMSSSYIDYT